MGGWSTNCSAHFYIGVFGITVTIGCVYRPLPHTASTRPRSVVGFEVEESPALAPSWKPRAATRNPDGPVDLSPTLRTDGAPGAEWKESERQLDREWYDQDEGTGAVDDTHNPFVGALGAGCLGVFGGVLGGGVACVICVWCVVCVVLWRVFSGFLGGLCDVVWCVRRTPFKPPAC